MIERLEALPKKAGARTLPPRPNEEYITVHYSGVVYNDNTEEKELERIVAETRFHLNRVWGHVLDPSTKKSIPIYGDGLMYDYVVLKSGGVIQTRRNRVQLWHCGNTDGNRLSWSVHVMLGRDEMLTSSQREGLFKLIDKLRAECNIPRENVVGHCEWPKGKGLPVVSSSYSPLPGQSLCPGEKIMEDIYTYRAMTDTPKQIISTPKQVIGNAGPVFVYTSRSVESPVASISGNPVVLPPGAIIEIGDVTDGWGHITSEIGFVPLMHLKEVGSEDPPTVVKPVVKRTYTETSPIIVEHQSDVNFEGIVKHLANVKGQTYTEQDIRLIVGYYKEYGELTGVDWVLALSQNLHETGNLTSWWAARPRRNPAGLRVTGVMQEKEPPSSDPHWAFDPDRKVWRKGMSFPTWEMSVRAHLAWLISYARTNQELTPAQTLFIQQSPAYFVLQRTTYRGVAPTLVGLNGRWAVPGTTYATKIARVANSLSQK